MTGRYDDDINETGIKQAYEAIKDVEAIDYDVIISSPLLRAKHTAEIVNVKGLELLLDDRIQERDMGYLTNASTHLEIDRFDYWNLRPKKDYRDVEPLSDMYDRVAEFFEDIKVKYQGKTVLAVTHDGMVRVLHGYLYGVAEDGTLLEGNIKNCEVREMIY